MKHTLFLFLFMFAVGALFAQQSNGIRIGNGNSGKTFIPNVVTDFSTNLLEISATGEKISGFEIFDSNNEVVVTTEISSTKETSINIKGLKEGVYFVAITSETGQVHMDTFFKQ